MDTTNPENPFRAIRLNGNLTQSDFARALGVGLASIEQAENGTAARPRTLILALVALGFDQARLFADYNVWRDARAAPIRDVLRSASRVSEAGSER